MRRLLFLIADTGGGHRAAATAVERQMATEFPGEFEITILDPFTSAKPKVIGGTAGLYGPITRRARWLWGGLYHSTNSRSAVALLETTVLRSVTNAVSEAIERIDPDGVVSFHPLLNHISVRAVRSRARTIPVITVITDLVDIHVCVDGARRRRGGHPIARCAGSVPPRRAFPRRAATISDWRLTGDSPSFPAIQPASPGFASALGLRNDSLRGARVRRRRRIAAGSSSMRGRSPPRASISIVVVICGRNERARAALAGLRTAAGRAVRVLGYVNNMPQWMRASDVVVSKAGPGTIAEALCCGLPLLLVWYLPGQERGNVEWVVDIGAGRYVPRDEQLVDAVTELADPGSEALATMRDRCAGSRATRRHDGASPS